MAYERLLLQVNKCLDIAKKRVKKKLRIQNLMGYELSREVLLRSLNFGIVLHPLTLPFRCTQRGHRIK